MSHFCWLPTAFTQPVADTILGYMLCFARQIPWMDQEMRQGQWEKRPGFALREATLGVIGVGNVGRALIQRAIGFGMKVLGDDVVPPEKSFVVETRLEMVSKEELLARSDFVSLNCDLNPSSYHVIGTAEFDMMKPTSYLINTARGPLVDESALCVALADKKLAGAALDVFEIEPLPEGSPLRRLDNCLLAPHNANSSPEAYQRVHENTIRNLLHQLQNSNRPTGE